MSTRWAITLNVHDCDLEGDRLEVHATAVIVADDIEGQHPRVTMARYAEAHFRDLGFWRAMDRPDARVSVTGSLIATEART